MNHSEFNDWIVKHNHYEKIKEQECRDAYTEGALDMMDFLSDKHISRGTIYRVLKTFFTSTDDIDCLMESDFKDNIALVTKVTDEIFDELNGEAGK